MSLKQHPIPCIVLLYLLPILIWATPDEDAEFLVNWLLEDESRLETVPFASIVKASSGHTLLPVDDDSSVDLRILEAISTATKDCIQQLNTSSHSIHQIGRINEVSRPIEGFLLDTLNAQSDLLCSIPRNASGERQRSGYPDLRIEHLDSGRVFYLDPKVYRSGSERSSFRTFYFEPKMKTNKILDDASHLILGISHSGKMDGQWQLDGWQLIDLIDFKVRLKAEFQASNRELYREGAVLRSGVHKKAASHEETAEKEQAITLSD